MQLPKGKLEVIPVVQYIQKVSIKGVNVVHLGEVLQNGCELVMPVGLRVLDLQK